MIDLDEFAYDEMDIAIRQATDVKALRDHVQRILRVVQKRIKRLGELDPVADPTFNDGQVTAAMSALPTSGLEPVRSIARDVMAGLKGLDVQIARAQS